MEARAASWAALAVAVLLASAVFAVGVAGGSDADDRTSPPPLYTYDPNWPQWSSCPGAAAVSMISAVAVDAAAGEVYVGQRSASYDPVIVFDADSGLYLRSWGKGLITEVHGLRVQPAEYSHTAPNATVWVTDVGDHTVKQFTTGRDAPARLLTTLGTPFQNGSGVDPIQFGNVADVAFGSDGRVYVSDGDDGQNHRISCFVPPYSAAHDTAWIFGRFGTSPNDFASPHSIAMDQMQRLWVADRDNNRTVLFGQSAAGTAPVWLGRWNCFKPGVVWGVAVWQAQSWMISADGVSSAIIVSDIESDRAENHCNRLFTAPVDAGAGGQVHLLDVDQRRGDVYVAVVGAAPNTFVRRFRYTP